MAENAITAQKGKIVGDEAVQAEVVEVKPDVTQEAVAAQVVQPREKDPSKVNVHETRVDTDVVITDPSSPLAVQVPDAGKSPLLSDGLPIHRLGSGSVEDVFAAEASEPDKADDDSSSKK